jgi:TonB-dependent receptor
VFNATNASTLPNARIAIEGTTREVLTDEAGRYRLTGLAPGMVRVGASYLGFDRQATTIQVNAVGTAALDFELSPTGLDRAAGETLKLDAFNVTADRAMSAQALAMNEQRHAPNIKHVVAFDEFGERGDENVGEFLRFLPGVALIDASHVPNEVTLRGFPSSSSNITIDGGDVVGARGGATRTVSLLEVSTANISRLEVTKVPTPDMPASGLGGTINLINKNGFDAKKPAFSYQLYQLFHNWSHLSLEGGPPGHVAATSPRKTRPSGNFSYLHPVNRNFAFTVGGTRTWRQKRGERGDIADETATWDLVRLYRTASQWLSRPEVMSTWAAQAGFDWRITPRDTVSVSLQTRASDSYITRDSFNVTYGAGAVGDNNFTQGAATAVGLVAQGQGGNAQILTQSRVGSIRYRHDAEVWRLEASSNWSLSKAWNRDVNNGHFISMNTRIENLIVRGDTLDSDFLLPTHYTARLRTGEPVDIFDGGNYAIVAGNSTQQDSKASNLSGRLDLTRNFTSRFPWSLKSGVRVDRLDRDIRQFPRTWNFRPNGATDVASRLAGRFDVFDQPYLDQAPTLYGQPMRWISNRKLYELMQKQPAWFVLDEPLAHQNRVANSRRLIETISSAYVRADLRLFQNRFWLATGVRLEKTEDEGWGQRNDPSAQYQKDAQGRVVDGNPAQSGIQPIFLTNDLLERAKLRYVERGTHANRDYQGYYPSLNTTYSISDNLVIRGAYARTIGRPDVTSVVPSATFTEPTVLVPTITVTNPGLKPWTADNFDLSVESYHLKDGFGSLGVFQKNIRDFFGSVRTPATRELLALYGLPEDPAFLSYEIATTNNVGDAKVTGFEYSYRQSLTFLPRWARGLQVFVSGSRMRLHGNQAANFTGFNPSSYAGGIHLIRPRFLIKLGGTYQAETRRTPVAQSATIPANTYDYQVAALRYTLNVQYNLSKRVALYGSANDFIGGYRWANRRWAPGSPEYARDQRVSNGGFNTTIGVKGDF